MFTRICGLWLTVCILCCGGSPGFFEMLSFKSHIEGLPGGGDLLQGIVDNLRGVNAEQLREVGRMIPLLDAQNGKPNGGFLQLMVTIDSTPEGEKLILWMIDILGNITTEQINDINDLVPLFGGEVSASKGATMLSRYMTGNSTDLLLTFLGSNSSSFLEGIADLLEPGSITGAIERVITPGTPSNKLVMEYGHRFGGDTLSSVTKTFLPIVGPYIYLAFSKPHHESRKHAMDMIRELNERLGNATFQEEIGSGIAKLASVLLRNVFGFIGNLETEAVPYDFTLSKEPLEAIVTLVGNLNTTVIVDLLGNSTLTEQLLDIVNNSGSADGLGRYLAKEALDFLAGPAASQFMGQMIAKGTVYAMRLGVDTFMSFVDNPDMFYNLSFTHPVDAIVTVLSDINVTTLEKFLGNHSLSDGIVSLLSHSSSKADLRDFVFNFLLEQLKKPATFEFMGEVLAKAGGYIVSKGVSTLASLVDNPEDLYNISLANPLQAVALIVQDLNITELDAFLGNSTLGRALVSLVTHSQSEGSLADYLMNLVMDQIRKPSTHEFLGEIIANMTVKFLNKGYDFLDQYVDDTSIISNITFLKPLNALMTILPQLNVTKLRGLFGDTSLADNIIDFVGHAGSIRNITKFIMEKILNEVRKPSTQRDIGEFIANVSSVMLNEGLQVLSVVVDIPEELNNLSMFNPVTTIRRIVDKINITKLEVLMGNSTLAEVIVEVVSMIKEPGTILHRITHLLLNPDILTTISSYTNGLPSNILQLIAAVVATTEDNLEEKTFSLGSAMTLLQNINITVLNSSLDDSSLSSDLLSLVSKLQSPGDVPPPELQCSRDIDALMQGAVDLDMWALQMLDASGKPGSSILQGAAKFFGNYDECLGVSTTVNTEDGGQRDLRGSYCRLVIMPEREMMEQSGLLDTPVPLPEDYPLTMEWHLCLPHSCDETIVSSVLSLLPLESMNASLHKVECHKDDDVTKDSAADLGIAVICVILTLTVIGTVYDTIYEELRRARMKNSHYSENKDYAPAKPAKNWMAMMVFEGGEGDDTVVRESVNGYTVKSTEDDDGESNDDDEGFCRRILLAFSISRNTDKIFSAGQQEDTLGCIHGLRVISMAFIILGHVAIYTYGVTVQNGVQAMDYVELFLMQPVVNATLDVDTFFLIGGCLVAYLFIKKVKKTGKLTCRQMVLYYVHRLWRLWPLYMVVLMLYTCLFPHLIDGPLRTDGLEYDNTHCRHNWWTNLLFINNVYNISEGCMKWTWFMATDMQFYIIAPLALVPIVMGIPVIGIIVMVLLFVVQIATYAYKEYFINGSMLVNTKQFENEIYFMPWCRVGVFAMGLMLGYIISKYKRVRIPYILVVLGWLVFLTIGMLCIFITWDEWRVGHVNWSRDTRLVHETLSRPGWALFISWVIFVCSTGYGGFVNRFLSWSAFVPLGRLTYGAYLIHPILITYSDFSRRSLAYVDIIYMNYQFLGTFTLSYLLSYMVTVMVETPCLALEKLMYRSPDKITHKE